MPTLKLMVTTQNRTGKKSFLLNESRPLLQLVVALKLNFLQASFTFPVHPLPFDVHDKICCVNKRSRQACCLMCYTFYMKYVTHVT